MREIKFRAWDEERKTFIYFNFNMLLERIMADSSASVVMKILLSKERQQFTGLKDKNGKEIFEGDFLKFGNEDKKPKSTFSLVYWDEYQAHFASEKSFLTGGGSSGELNSWNNYLNKIKKLDFCEVIGNKFENPELLK